MKASTDADRQQRRHLPRHSWRPTPSVIEASLPEDLAVKLERHAQETGQAPEAVARQAIKEFLAVER